MFTIFTLTRILSIPRLSGGEVITTASAAAAASTAAFAASARLCYGFENILVFLHN